VRAQTTIPQLDTTDNYKTGKYLIADSTQQQQCRQQHTAAEIWNSTGEFCHVRAFSQLGVVR
jgi:hypothetical protein